MVNHIMRMDYGEGVGLNLNVRTKRVECVDGSVYLLSVSTTHYNDVFFKKKLC